MDNFCALCMCALEKPTVFDDKKNAYCDERCKKWMMEWVSLPDDKPSSYQYYIRKRYMAA